MIEWLVGKGQASEFNEWALVFQNMPSLFSAVFVGFLAIVLIALFWRNLKRLSSPGWKAALFTLRLLFFIGLLALWLQPAIELRKVLYKKTHALFFVDVSRSMTLQADETGASRSQRVAEFFQNKGDFLRRIGQSRHSHAFTFDKLARPIAMGALKKPIAARGAHTSIAQTLDEALEGYQMGEVAGVFLFSDGMENPPDATQPKLDDVLKAYIERAIPVYTFGAGDETKIKDIAIDEVRYDGFAFVHNKMTVEVDVSSTGYPARSVQVNLEKDGRSIASKMIEVPAEGKAKAAFSFTPKKVGRYVYTIQIPKASEDAVSENNTRGFIVDVIRDKIRVLHVCGHPDYDEQFMRRFLKNNPNVDLISFFILRTNADLQLVPQDELSLIPFPTDELFDKQLHTFDLVIFQNFTYRGYRMRQYLPNLKRFVKEGGAFLVIGGDVSYGMGGWDNTEVEEILPFRILPSDPPADQQRFSPILTKEGERHPITALSRQPEVNRKIWESLPKLLGLNLGLTPYPDTVVLAEHPSLTIYGQSAPVIGIREIGDGRVVGLSVDSTWGWHFLDVAEGGDGGHYRTFWGNVLRWLIKDPELKHLKARADKDTVAPDEEVRLDLRLSDEKFLPKPDTPMKIKVIDEATKKTLFEKEARTDEEGAAFLSFDAPAKEGLVKVEITSQEADPNLRETDELLLFVTNKSGELKNVKVDFDRLRYIAQKTGGRFFSLPDADVSEIELKKQAGRQIGKKRDFPIWDNGWVLILLTLLIAAEWWFRKRKRLH